MSDLINRADAIKVLTKVPGVGRRAIEELSALPAAEDLPEGSHNGREYIAQDIVNAKGFIIGNHCREAVVRCGDCKHYQNEHICMYFSRHGTIETSSYAYCSYGERREP